MSIELPMKIMKINGMINVIKTPFYATTLIVAINSFSSCDWNYAGTSI